MKIFQLVYWLNNIEAFLLENIRLNQQEVEAVKELETGDEFFGGKHTHKNYLASRLTVKDIEPLRLCRRLALIRKEA